MRYQLTLLRPKAVAMLYLHAPRLKAFTHRAIGLVLIVAGLAKLAGGGADSSFRGPHVADRIRSHL